MSTLEELEKKTEVAKVAYDNAMDAAADAKFAAKIAMDAAFSAIWAAADASETYDALVEVYVAARNQSYRDAHYSAKENTK